MGQHYFEKRHGTRRTLPDGFIVPGGSVGSISGGLDVQSLFNVGGINIADSRFAGVVSVNSNATVATVSTTAVASDSNIQITALNMVAISMTNISVSSRVDSVSFAVNLGLADIAIVHPIGWTILG